MVEIGALPTALDVGRALYPKPCIILYLQCFDPRMIRATVFAINNTRNIPHAVKH